VHTAVDGVAGLAAVELHQPDLIVTDVMMPRMDGYEMIRRVHLIALVLQREGQQ
jgi:CheY-like chemotaxis protein